MTDQELKDLVARLAEESEKVKKAQQETERAQQQTEKAQRQTEKQMRQTLKALGGLGNSLGEMTEGLVYPSVAKILRQRFNADFVARNVRRRRNGTELELDAFGYSTGKHGEVYVVEIKTKFGEEQYRQLLKTLTAFPRFFPEHADKPVYGLVAAVTVPDNLRQRLLKAGIYVARIHDNICTLRVPRTFKAKAFHADASASQGGRLT
jgi:hypothetical protein